MDKALRTLITGCFHFLFLVTPLFFLFTTDELFEFNKMMLTYGVTLIIASAWILRMILAGKPLIRRTPFDWVLLAFLGSQVLSTIFSMHPRTSMLGYYSRFHGGLLSTISYLVLYWVFVSTVSAKELRSYFASLFAAASLVSIYAILERFGHSTSCLLITNGQSFGTECWIQDVQSRVFATFGQPNWLAAYLITLLPLGVVLASTAKGIARFVMVVISALLFFALVFTQSRSGMLGFAVGFVVLSALQIIGWLRQARQAKTTKRAGIIGQLAALIALREVQTFLLCGALFAVGLPLWSPLKPYLAKLGAPSQSVVQPHASESGQAESQAPVVNRLEVGGTDSGEIRKIVWQGALDVARRYPLLGSGVETFAYSYYLDRPLAHNLVSEWDFLYNKAHNEFLNFFATTGIVGLATYTAIIGWFCFLALKAVIAPRETMGLSKQDQQVNVALTSALLSGMIALSISNFFGFSTVMVAILFFLFPAWLTLLWGWQAPNTTYSQSSTDMPKSRAATYFMSAVVVALTLVGALNLHASWAADIAYAQGKSLFGAGQYQAGLQRLTQAIMLSPKEALFYDELAIDYSQVATAMAAEDATSAAQLAQAAVDASDMALSLNNVHLNFYKTRSRVFITLAQLDDQLLPYAKEALLAALDRSPTDAKLMYNLGLVALGMNQQDEGIEWLRKAVAAKANYGAARIQLADALREKGELESAATEYRYILDVLSPEDSRAREALASTEAELKKSDSALKH